MRRDRQAHHYSRTACSMIPAWYPLHPDGSAIPRTLNTVCGAICAAYGSAVSAIRWGRTPAHIDTGAQRIQSRRSRGVRARADASGRMNCSRASPRCSSSAMAPPGRWVYLHWRRDPAGRSLARVPVQAGRRVAALAPSPIRREGLRFLSFMGNSGAVFCSGAGAAASPPFELVRRPRSAPLQTQRRRAPPASAGLEVLLATPDLRRLVACAACQTCAGQATGVCWCWRSMLVIACGYGLRTHLRVILLLPDSRMRSCAAHRVVHSSSSEVTCAADAAGRVAYCRANTRLGGSGKPQRWLPAAILLTRWHYVWRLAAERRCDLQPWRWPKLMCGGALAIWSLR